MTDFSVKDEYPNAQTEGFFPPIISRVLKPTGELIAQAEVVGRYVLPDNSVVGFWVRTKPADKIGADKEGYAYWDARPIEVRC